MKKKCVICGFDKKVEKHHIIRYLHYGSDNDNNLVYLCPNHHWIADFGDRIDREMLLKKIKEITGKKGEVNYSKKVYIEKLIRALIENNLGKYSDEEYEKEILDSYNYSSIKKILLSRNPDIVEIKKEQIKKAEILYLIQKLNNILNKKIS